MLQKQQLIEFCAAAAPYADGLNEVCDRYAIDTTLRRAHFLAQIAHESAGFTRTREGLNYTVDALLSLFGRHRISEADARAHGRIDEVVGGKKVVKRPANQPAIANHLYGGDWGKKNLGNTEPGDGAKFIGHGLKQLTGRANHLNASMGVHGDDRYIRDPSLLERAPDAVLSAGWFWDNRKLNGLADKDDLLSITYVVNGGTNGLDDNDRSDLDTRMDWLVRAKEILK